MRVLLIGSAQREAAHALVEFASRDENIYRPPLTPNWIPGLDPRYVVHLGVLGDFRCVFSVTEMDPGVLSRHLSISTPSGYPHPVMVEEIAHLFGFTGNLTDWIGGPYEPERCIIVAQRMLKEASHAGS